ncbi:MAG: DUF3368 domain-containing protein [Halobacteriales archaeon]
MPEAVADATVLIFLGKLRRLDWLRRRYATVRMPAVVHEEVVVRGRDRGEPDAAVVADAVDAGWLKVHEVDEHPRLDRFELEPGEIGVLSLAIERDLERVLVDEESVREVARLVGLRPRGTLSVLFDALERGDVDFDGFLQLLEQLLENGFYLDEAVYLEAVRRAWDLAES